MSETLPIDLVQAQVKDALKSGDKVRLATLRLLLSSVKNETIRLGKPVEDTDFVGIVQKGIKQRREAAAAFRQGGREESAEREEREAEILAEYLPPQASEEVIREAVTDLVEAQDLAGPQALGAVMGAMMARFQGQADGGTINRIAREILESRS